MSTVAEGIRMAEDPAKYFARSNRAAHAVPREDMEAMQLAVLQQRFATLRDRLPVLEATAEEQGITDISSFEDGGRLLFPHTVYKSYPVSLLERNRFPQLTKWLSRLTTTDLSRAEVGDCEGIDAWLAALEESTGLSVTHSSGTSGTMTFLPRSSEGYRIISDVFGMASREFHDLSDRDNAPWHTFYLGFQGGRSHAGRAAQWALDNFAHDTDHFYPLYHVDMSSDVMFMAARVRQAEARGELSRLEISPAMRTRQTEFEAVQRDTGKALERTFEQLVALKGERVYIGGMSGAVTDLAQRGLALGMRNIFEGNCILQCGGGKKGGVLADNWEDLCKDFTGAKRIGLYYGMTEVTMTSAKCSEGHYHVPPWVIAYVLDPDTGRILPRQGVHTGRAAFFDLVPDNYWGGIVSGDEITLDWEPCPCGRTTAHIHPQIERLSEKRGGDDKITCAAAEDAHAAAIGFLVQ